MKKLEDLEREEGDKEKGPIEERNRAPMSGMAGAFMSFKEKINAVLRQIVHIIYYMRTSKIRDLGRKGGTPKE